LADEGQTEKPGELSRAGNTCFRTRKQKRNAGNQKKEITKEEKRNQKGEAKGLSLSTARKPAKQKIKRPTPKCYQSRTTETEGLRVRGDKCHEKAGIGRRCAASSSERGLAPTNQKERGKGLI